MAAFAIARFCASCTAASASRCASRQLDTPRPVFTCNVACVPAMAACDSRFTGDGLGVGVGHRDTHVALGRLGLRLALEGGRLLADLLLLVEVGDAHRLLPLRLLDLGVAL